MAWRSSGAPALARQSGAEVGDGRIVLVAPGCGRPLRADLGSGGGWQGHSDPGEAVRQAGRETAGVQRRSTVRQYPGRFRDDRFDPDQPGNTVPIYGEGTSAEISRVAQNAAPTRSLTPLGL